MIVKSCLLFHFLRILLGLMQIERVNALSDSRHSNYTKPPPIDPIAMAEQGGFIPELLDRNVLHTGRTDKLSCDFCSGSSESERIRL